MSEQQRLEQLQEAWGGYEKLHVLPDHPNCCVMKFMHRGTYWFAGNEVRDDKVEFCEVRVGREDVITAERIHEAYDELLELLLPKPDVVASKFKCIATHQEELRLLDDVAQYNQKLGVIRHLQQLKVGSWVTTPECGGPELVVGMSTTSEEGTVVEVREGQGYWAASDVTVVG